MKDWWPIILGVFEAVYIISTVLVAAKIITDTRTASKTLAYLLLIVILPFVGIVFYFTFGISYRKNKFYDFKVERNQAIYEEVIRYINETNQRVLAENKEELSSFKNTIMLLANGTKSPAIGGNAVEILQNGEEKFERVFEVIRKAKHHIHLEYYIYDADEIGLELAELLKQKAREGVRVRFLYDALGSKLKKRFRKNMSEAGVEIKPVNEIRFRILANRINYRDHRKIIIVDGHEAFTGGINVSDKYINNGRGEVYWRDTHLYLKGPGVFYLQYLFLSNWVHTNEKLIGFDRAYVNNEECPENKIVQIAASGPDTKPAIMYSTVSAIHNAKERLYITTPYFIPPDPVLLAIKNAAWSGVDVRLIVPEVSDSKLVNAAAYSYFSELFDAGVRVYLYQKGFVHAKTMLVDDMVSQIGTANMDIRSHELNFEVNTFVYDKEINNNLYNDFMRDLDDCIEINAQEWVGRSKLKMFFEHLARLLSPLL